MIYHEKSSNQRINTIKNLSLFVIDSTDSINKEVLIASYASISSDRTNDFDEIFRVVPAVWLEERKYYKH